MNKFIHQASCIYLAGIILLRMMAMPISLLDYNLNQRFIADNLCENRFNTALHCGGKCYLVKHLKNANDGQQTGDQKETTRNIIIDFCQPLEKPCFDCKNTLSANHKTFISVLFTSWNTDNIFHPPILTLTA